MPKLLRQNVGGTDYTMVGCALTGVCASAADAFIKAVTLSDGDEISDGMTVIVTFANGNTAGTAPASKTIYSSDQVSYYEDSGLTVPFTLAPAGCYTITYTGAGNAYTYISYPVIQIGNVTGVICDASGNAVSGSLWAKGAQIGIMFKDGKFLLVSGALLNNMAALPTDAVLHYSFDDIPDYPDGTAVEKHIKDFTSVPSGWNSNNKGVLSVANGELINTMTNGTNPYIRRFYSSQDNGIIKIKIRATIDCSISISYYDGSRYVTLASVGNAKAQQAYILAAFIPIIDYILIQATAPTATDFQLILSEYYLGGGSYVTPIIDNTNGQNNGTNNGGLAVKGLSGKGAYFLGGKYIVTKFNFTDNFSVSVWVKPDNVDSGKIGNIVAKGNCFVIRNGDSETNNYVFGAVYNKATSRYVYFTVQLTLLDNTKYTHICITKDGATLKAFVNGVLTTTNNLSFTEINKSDYSLNVGNTSNTRPQTIDDLLIFDRALSEAEVMALYLNRANTPKYYSWADWKLQQMA